MCLKVSFLHGDGSVQNGYHVARRKTVKASLGLRMVTAVKVLAEGSWIMVPKKFPSGIDSANEGQIGAVKCHETKRLCLFPLSPTH